MLGAWARGVRFEEERPAKTWSELIEKKNEKYKISESASSAYESTKSGIMNLWGYATAATDEEQAAQKEQE